MGRLVGVRRSRVMAPVTRRLPYRVEKRMNLVEIRGPQDAEPVSRGACFCLHRNGSTVWTNGLCEQSAFFFNFKLRQAPDPLHKQLSAAWQNTRVCRSDPDRQRCIMFCQRKHGAKPNPTSCCIFSSLKIRLILIHTYFSMPCFLERTISRLVADLNPHSERTDLHRGLDFSGRRGIALF